MNMEDIGQEAIKRQRLDSLTGNSSHRTHPQQQQQQQPEPPLQLYNYQGAQALGPPNAYSQPPPPSPYETAHEARPPLPEHPQQARYPPQHSGYNTPIRDSRPPLPDHPAVYQHRPGSHSAPTRSPDEIPHTGPLRPLNTNFDADGQQYPPNANHEAVENPAAFPTQEPLSNGQFHGLPMAPHQEPIQGPPPGSGPGYVEPSMAQAQYGAPYSAGPYSAPPNAWAGRHVVQPRKNTRATQACETCRARKAKCDEGKPVCGYCKENCHTCHYKEVQPAKADRAQREVMDQLKGNSEDIHQVEEKVNHVEEKLENMSQKMSSIQNAIAAFAKFIPELGLAKPREEESKNTVVHTDPFIPPMPPKLNAAYVSPDQNQHHRDLNIHDASESTTIGEITSGSIHVDHSTGAHNLLRWPSIRRLLDGRHIPDHYVMQQEERKGLLRIYGKGQGIDTWDGSLTGGPGSPASSTSGEDVTRSPGSSPPDLWGTTLGPPNMPDGRFVNNKKDHPGGLNPDGSLKLDKLTMYELEKSYLSNLHILHPFLDKTRLRRMIDRVHLSANSQELNQIRSPYLPHPAVFSQDMRQHNRNLKRKHSSGEHGSDVGGTYAYLGGSQPPLERRISTAIVLLVMALGKICEHTDNLPGPVFDAPKDAHANTSSPYNHTQSPRNSASSPIATIDLRNASWNHRSNAADAGGYNVRKGDKNVDVIPGLAYFARAVEILGGLQGNDLPYVQANLLAALYTSQLACVIESWTWIQHACRACHFLIRDPPSLEKMRDPTRAEMIRFAYWTCHQLEGDILAELDLKPSGIAQVENMQYPAGVTLDPADLRDNDKPDTKMMLYYSSQIILRKNLNEFQKILYPPEIWQSDAGRFSLRSRNKCDETISAWRSLLPKEMRWDDKDLPCDNINGARLRAKYYGAKYIIHRPFLYYALEHISPDLMTTEVMQHYRSFEQNPEAYECAEPDPSSTPEQMQAWNTFQFLMSCKLCVDAAKRSTLALDGIIPHRRLIVTNIFGTAHAQFGNVLVLAAVSTSRNLSWIVERNEVIGLCRRTINFLRTLAPISSTLATDVSILESVLQKLDHRAASTSFSSNMSGP